MECMYDPGKPTSRASFLVMYTTPYLDRSSYIPTYNYKRTHVPLWLHMGLNVGARLGMGNPCACAIAASWQHLKYICSRSGYCYMYVHTSSSVAKRIDPRP